MICFCESHFLSREHSHVPGNTEPSHVEAWTFSFPWGFIPLLVLGPRPINWVVVLALAQQILASSWTTSGDVLHYYRICRSMSAAAAARGPDPCRGPANWEERRRHGSRLSVTHLVFAWKGCKNGMMAILYSLGPCIIFPVTETGRNLYQDQSLHCQMTRPKPPQSPQNKFISTFRNCRQKRNLLLTDQHQVPFNVVFILVLRAVISIAPPSPAQEQHTVIPPNWISFNCVFHSSPWGLCLLRLRFFC